MTFANMYHLIDGTQEIRIIDTNSGELFYEGQKFNAPCNVHSFEIAADKSVNEVITEWEVVAIYTTANKLVIEVI